MLFQYDDIDDAIVKGDIYAWQLVGIMGLPLGSLIY